MDIKEMIVEVNLAFYARGKELINFRDNVAKNLKEREWYTHKINDALVASKEVVNILGMVEAVFGTDPREWDKKKEETPDGSQA